MPITVNNTEELIDRVGRLDTLLAILTSEVDSVVASIRGRLEVAEDPYVEAMLHRLAFLSTVAEERRCLLAGEEF